MVSVVWLVPFGLSAAPSTRFTIEQYQLWAIRARRSGDEPKLPTHYYQLALTKSFYSDYALGVGQDPPSPGRPTRQITHLHASRVAWSTSRVVKKVLLVKRLV